MKLQLYYPFKTFFVSQRFGEVAFLDFYKEHNIPIQYHNGIDYVSPNIYVRASHDGTVTFAGYDGSGGLGIVIRTDEMYDYKDGQSYYKSIYWHLKEGSIRVKPDQKVRVGDIIAEQDNTGVSAGTHLHFGLKPIYQGEQDWQWLNLEQDNGVMGAIDPQPYMIGKWAGEKRFAILDILKSLGVPQSLIDTIRELL